MKDARKELKDKVPVDYTHTQDRFTVDWNKKEKYLGLLDEEIAKAKEELSKL